MSKMLLREIRYLHHIQCAGKVIQATDSIRTSSIFGVVGEIDLAMNYVARGAQY